MIFQSGMLCYVCLFDGAHCYFISNWMFANSNYTEKATEITIVNW